MGTLTLTELEAEIRANLGNRTDLDSRLPRILSLAQEVIMRAHPFSEMNSEETLTTVADTKTVNLPTNPREVYSVRLIDNSNSRKLRYIPLRQWDRRAPYPEHYTTGRPSLYTLYNDKIELWRIPDAAYTIYCRCNLMPTEFSSDSDVASDLENKDDLLIAIATEYCFRSLGGDTERIMRWQSVATNGLRNAIKADTQFEDQVISSERARTTVTDDYWLNPFIRRAP